MKSIEPVTKINSDEPVNPRRHFLLGATLGTAGVVAAAVSPDVLPVAASDEVKVATKQSGYRLTPHIEHYYRTTQM